MRREGREEVQGVGEGAEGYVGVAGGAEEAGEVLGVGVCFAEEVEEAASEEGVERDVGFGFGVGV